MGGTHDQPTHTMPQTSSSKTAAKQHRAEDYCLIYVTCANAPEAEKIGIALVKQRLVACVNILPPVQSIYWWQGQMENSAEWAFIAKTRCILVADITQKVREIHSYDLPCVVALPLQQAADDFLDWIDQETQPSGKPSLNRDLS